MWWKNKKKSNEQIIKQIIEESLTQNGMTADIIATRIAREVGVEYEAALNLSKKALSEFLSIGYNKKINIIKEEFPEYFTLPFSEKNKTIVKELIDRLANNQIEFDQFIDSIYEIQFLESREWFIKGIESKILGKIDDALHNFDTSLEFDSDNKDALVERGQLLQNLNFHKDAIKDFTKIIEDDENNFNIFYLRGCSYLRLCEYEKSFTDITKAIEKSIMANENQKEFTNDMGYNSIEEMYNATLDLLETLKDSPYEVTSKIIEKNGKERIK